jgi:hypothetical protein
MRLIRIDVERFKTEYELALHSLELVLEEVSDEDDPWTVDQFEFMVLDSDDRTVVAERVGSTGPREPTLIWSGGIADDPHEARWFSSEDATLSEHNLGTFLNDLSPAGLGGW